MTVLLSILRGINVSGQKKIQMTDLKVLYEQLNFKNITTYIQSGNVVFKAENSKNLNKKIEQKIFEKYNFDVPVIIRTTVEMQTIIEENPFLKRKNIDPEKLYVTFLEERPSSDLIENISKINYEPDTFIIWDKEIYLYCPNGYGNTKLNTNFFENKLKVKATTRNWKTANELLALMLR